MYVTSTAPLKQALLRVLEQLMSVQSIDDAHRLLIYNSVAAASSSQTVLFLPPPHPRAAVPPREVISDN